MEKTLVLSCSAMKLWNNALTSLTSSTPAQVSRMPKIHTFLQRSLCSYCIQTQTSNTWESHLSPVCAAKAASLMTINDGYWDFLLQQCVKVP